MSCEVVVSVDRERSLSAVLVHDHGTEVLGEELIIGPQVEFKPPGLTNTQQHVCPIIIKRTSINCKQDLRKKKKHKVQPLQGIKAQQLLHVSLSLDISTAN